MNRFVKVAGIALVSLLAVAGAAQAQTWFQWKAPLSPFPIQDEIIPPIDTGKVAQPRGGVINVSSTNPYPLIFSSTTAQGFNIWGGKFNLNGDLQFPKPANIGSPVNGLIFADGTAQTEAAYGRLGKGKFCSAISPGNWRDSFQVVDDFTRAACAKYAADTAASTWQIGCLSGTGVRWGTNLPPTPNCGWDTPAAPPPADPGCHYWYTDIYGTAHYKPAYNCP